MKSAIDFADGRLGGDIQAADLFAGGGGFSSGLAFACRQLGVRPRLAAINHWPVAIETHRMNHPWARHFCETVGEVDPLRAVPGGKLNVLAASPECTYFSSARGGRPTQDQQRPSGLDIRRWIRRLEVDAIVIENVVEFRNWGEVDPVTGLPIKSRKGLRYRDFLNGVREEGFTVQDQVLNAADYGDATTRKRLYIMARRDGKPILWPKQTHSYKGRVPGTKPWRPASEVIDLDLPSQSMFLKPFARNTWARVIRGVYWHGGRRAFAHADLLERQLYGRVGVIPRPKADASDNGIPFTIGVCGRNLLPDGLDEPLPTHVANRSTRHLIRGRLMSFTSSVERPVDNRSSMRPTTDPIATIPGSQRIALYEPFLLSQASGGVARGLSSPVPTIPGGGAHSLVDGEFILPPLGFFARGNQANKPKSLKEPMHTLTQRPTHLVQSFLVSYYSGGGQLSPLDEPLDTVTTRERHALCQPFLIPNFGERAGQPPRTHSLDAPMPSPTSHGAGRVVQPALRVAHTDGSFAIRRMDLPAEGVGSADRVMLMMTVIDGIGLDIQYRMLVQQELQLSMSFPKRYRFAGNKGERIKQIGNAVPVRNAKALFLSILGAPELAGLDMVEKEDTLLGVAA